MLVLTPSAELYGSDRALETVLGALSDRLDIAVLAASDGPLVERLRRLASVEVTADWALRRRQFSSVSSVASWVRAMGSTLRRIRRMHRRRPFDVVYVNTVAVPLVAGLRWAAPGAKVVVHMREMPQASDRSNRIYLQAMARGQTRFICNSAATASFLRRFASPWRLTIIPDAVAPIVPPDRAPRSGRPLRITCVGRLHPNKGQAVLLEAVAAGRRGGRTWEVDLWGDALPEYEDNVTALRAMAGSSDLRGAVRFRGFDADTAAVYASADVSVVPSTWPEGFSLVTAESAMAGLATIATSPGGPDDIIVDGVTGFLVPFADPGALGEKLAELDDDRQRLIEMGAAAHRRVLKEFAIEPVAERIRRELG